MLSHTHSAPGGAHASFLGTEISLTASEGNELNPILKLAADRFDVQRVLISLADESHAGLMMRAGLDEQDASYIIALRHRTIQSDDVVVVFDAHGEAKADHAKAELVTADQAIRFCASAPLILTTGERVGTLNLIDSRPRARFSDDDISVLALMAKLAAREMKVRLLQEKIRIGTVFADSSSDAFLTAAPDGRILFWNKGAERTFGYTAEEAIGQPLDIIIPPEHRGGHLAGMARLMAGERPRLVGRTIEVPAVRKDGTRITTELTLDMWSDPKTGLPVRFTSIIRDVGSRVVTEARVAGQLAAIEAAHEGIAIGDRDGIWSYMNEAFLRTFGLQAGSHDVPWTHLIAPFDRKRLADQTFSCETPWDHWHGEVQGLHSNGTRVDLDFSLTLKGDTVVCVARDITSYRHAERERARLREQLLVAQRQEAVGQLASGLAHDINNLIAAISGSADMIARSHDPDVARHTARIQAATQSAASLVQKMLSLGRRSRDYQPHDMRDVVTDTADLLLVGLAKRQRIQLELDPRPAIVMADRNEIIQVLLNLGLNARDALRAQPEGEIGMSVSFMDRAHVDRTIPLVQGTMPKGSLVKIQVWDNGCGMDPGEIENIFQPYYSRKEGSGTGLGLAMVAGILASVGAGLALKTSPGCGTSFDIYWPVELPPEPAPLLEPHSVAHDKCLEGLTILLVDDELPVLETLTAMLELAGAEVGACLDPSDAIAALESDPLAWSILVSDYNMPGMDGADLALAARTLRPDLPLVLITALPDEPRAHIGDVRLFDAVLGKPISLPALTQSILGAIARPTRQNLS